MRILKCYHAYCMLSSRLHAIKQTACYQVDCMLTCSQLLPCTIYSGIVNARMHAHCIETCTIHGAMHNAWSHAQCMETCTMHGDMHNAWRHAQCMETCTLHWGMHNAWRHPHCTVSCTLPWRRACSFQVSALKLHCIQLIEIIVYLKERASMHCQGIACTRSFNMGLQVAEAQKLECSKLTTNNICTSTMKIK
jgi:hypothetical protein